jgi:hypothetical protein
MLKNIIDHIVNAFKSFYHYITETEEEAQRREMIKFLNQATDRTHLEYLQSEWDKRNGRVYY